MDTSDAVPRDVKTKRSLQRPSKAWIAPLIIIVASLLFGVVHVPKHTSVSPLDEYVYIDYLAKVGDQLVVHRGEEVGPFARQELGCRGLRILAPAPDSRCQASTLNDDGIFPMGGVTSADFYTPLYFAATRVMAQPLLWFGFGNLTDAGRMTGWVWLALAGVLLFATMRRLRVHTFAALGTSLLVVGSASSYWANTYLSTDATALMAGALMAFLAVRVIQDKRGYAWLVAGATLVAMLKIQNFLAVVAVASVLAVLAFTDNLAQRVSWRSLFLKWIRDKRVVAAALALVVPLVFQLGWMAYRIATAVGPAPDQGVSSPLTKQALVAEAVNFLGAVGNPVSTPNYLGIPGIVVATIGIWLGIAGVIGLAAISKTGTIESAIGLSVLAVAILGGPALAVANTALAGFYFQLPPRYGLSLYPLFLMCAALMFRRTRAASYILGALGVISFVASLLFPETA